MAHPHGIHGAARPIAEGGSKATQTQPHTVVRLAYRLPASPHRVYRAWLEPDLVRRWMAPGDQEVTNVEIDERVGGHDRTWKADAGVIVGGFDSELLELVPDHCLVFRWGFIGPQRRGGPSFDTRLTITLRDDPAGATTLELVHDGLEELAATMLHSADNVGPGWEAILTKLERVLTADGDAPRTPGSRREGQEP